MSACPRALGDGRYRWRHDQVLRTLADTTTRWRRGRFTSSKPANAPPRSGCKINSCLLFTAQDCQWSVNIGERLNIPEQIATTTLRPDLILWSTEIRQLLLIELTIQWEENIDLTCERKLENYQELVE